MKVYETPELSREIGSARSLEWGYETKIANGKRKYLLIETQGKLLVYQIDGAGRAKHIGNGHLFKNFESSVIEFPVSEGGKCAYIKIDDRNKKTDLRGFGGLAA